MSESHSDAAAAVDEAPDVDRARLARVRDLRLDGFPRRLDRPYAVMTASLLVQAALHTFTFLCEVAAPASIEGAPGDVGGLLGHLYVASFFVFALAIPLGCFYWMRWLDWSVKNRIVASEGRFARSPAQVVWAYFIPGLNLFRPLADLRRLWRAASRFAGEAPGVVTAWWVATLSHLGLMAVALAMEGITVVTAASSALGILSNVLALMVLSVFWQVQRMAGPEREDADTDLPQGAAA